MTNFEKRKGYTNSMPFEFLSYVFELLHIKSRRSRVYHHCESFLIHATRDDIPLLSQWIKKSKSEDLDFLAVTNDYDAIIIKIQIHTVGHLLFMLFAVLCSYI